MALKHLTDQQLEMELKSILEDGRPLHTAAHYLIEAFESDDRAKKLTAIRFLQLHPEWSFWKKDFKPWLQGAEDWPWEFLLSWLGHQRFSLSLQDRDAFFETLTKQKAQGLLVKFPEWTSVFPQVLEARGPARFDIQRRILEIRDLLFEELRTWKFQQLHEQEMKVLARLKKKFPNDPDILSEQEKFKQNQAVEILGAKLRQKRGKRQRELRFVDDVETISEEWEEQILKFADQHPDKCYDLSIAFCFIDNWAIALKLINKAPITLDRDWLELEILLQLKRYVDVLQALHEIESRWSAEAETFFATAYARAQALYGLGQKQKALEVMESLLASRPLYRQGAELLYLWRGPS